MKKRLFSLLLALVMIFGTLPMTAHAAEPEIYVGGVGMVSGDYLASGATATVTTQPSGGYAYYDNGVLTLSGYYYSGRGYETGTESFGIYREGTLKIILNGKNTLTVTDTGKDNYGICAAGSGLTITEGGNSGTITIKTQEGIYSDGNITVESGSFTINAANTGITAPEGGITVNGGAFSISAGEAAIAANEAITVNGGTFDIIAEAAFLSGGSITVEGGAFVISAALYGLFASEITVNRGNMTVRATESVGCAFFCATVTIGSGLSVQASTEPYGTLGAYEAEYNDLYRLIVIKPAPKVLLGDVNMDGSINILDADLAAAYYNEASGLTSAQLTAADVNGDGKVDILDANLIAAYYNEMVDAFPAG